jgi:hypothetical protein
VRVSFFFYEVDLEIPCCLPHRDIVVIEWDEYAYTTNHNSEHKCCPSFAIDIDVETQRIL